MVLKEQVEDIRQDVSISKWEIGESLKLVKEAFREVSNVSFIHYIDGIQKRNKRQEQEIER